MADDGQIISFILRFRRLFRPAAPSDADERRAGVTRELSLIHRRSCGGCVHGAAGADRQVMARRHIRRDGQQRRPLEAAAAVRVHRDWRFDVLVLSLIASAARRARPSRSQGSVWNSHMRHCAADMCAVSININSFARRFLAVGDGVRVPVAGCGRLQSRFSGVLVHGVRGTVPREQRRWHRTLRSWCDYWNIIGSLAVPASISWRRD